MIGWSLSGYADFSRSGDVVTDTSTNLQWQDDADAKNVTKTWQEAIDYCETLTLAEKSDWRLPNINELASLIDDSQNYPDAENPHFLNIASAWYISSTTEAGDDSSGYVWFVDFQSREGQDQSVKISTYNVRCVRTGE